MAVRNLTHGTLKIKDGTSPTPNELVIPIMEGNLSFEEKHEAHVIKNRGRLEELSQGSEEAIMIDFDFTFERWEGKPSSGIPSVPDALMLRGEASGWTTTNPNKINSPKTTTLEFTIADVEGTGGGYNEVLTFALFSVDSFPFKEGQDANKVSVKGKSLQAIPVVDANATV